MPQQSGRRKTPAARPVPPSCSARPGAASPNTRRPSPASPAVSAAPGRFERCQEAADRPGCRPRGCAGSAPVAAKNSSQANDGGRGRRRSTTRPAGPRTAVNGDGEGGGSVIRGRRGPLVPVVRRVERADEHAETVSHSTTSRVAGGSARRRGAKGGAARARVPSSARVRVSCVHGVSPFRCRFQLQRMSSTRDAQVEVGPGAVGGVHGHAAGVPQREAGAVGQRQAGRRGCAAWKAAVRRDVRLVVERQDAADRRPAGRRRSGPSDRPAASSLANTSAAFTADSTARSRSLGRTRSRAGLAPHDRQHHRGVEHHLSHRERPRPGGRRSTRRPGPGRAGRVRRPRPGIGRVRRRPG